MGCEELQVFIPLGVRQRNKHLDYQMAGSAGIIAVVLAISTTGYMGWKPDSSILCGLI